MISSRVRTLVSSLGPQALRTGTGTGTSTGTGTWRPLLARYSSAAEPAAPDAPPAVPPVLPLATIREVLAAKALAGPSPAEAPSGEQQPVHVGGWVQTVRRMKRDLFLELSDGSTAKGIQVILPRDSVAFSQLLDQAAALGVADMSDTSADGLATGVSLEVRGRLTPSPGKNQTFELLADGVNILGLARSTFPLQKKFHRPEFLRDISHLRPKTRNFGSVLRVRDASSKSMHHILDNLGFVHIHTPILTTNDCEGAGETFEVKGPIFDGDGASTTATSPDGQQHYFGSPSYLTVSGQLQLEAAACGLSRVYTFGPTFRAENSHTSRHLSEFWMLEAEVAFIRSIQDIVGLTSTLFRSNIAAILSRCPEDLEHLEKNSPGLGERLAGFVGSGPPDGPNPFPVITYTEAIDILEREARGATSFLVGHAGSDAEGATHTAPALPPLAWGDNLSSDHERFLCERVFAGQPVYVVDYPQALKPFYMRQNDHADPARPTVAAMDMLVPGVGELIGGSVREERLDRLEQAIAGAGLCPEAYAWYTDLRRYGTVPHGGFGIGFERLIMVLTGMTNIRDAIPFPRYPGRCQL
ncbi:asparaginyl-tRNA synthetase [Fonticula alba]|uniref:asparagine--tRNA ligase n=1 Tax=Fonticula alba TaxID=691883 RepID=A0A058Z8S2_FONAL|nr:asparaginyl-tRNA synthetase [Fonticula alba]KCV70665.1 asparaginyl-tRNA synthetase [Fonticula alba]|eukprot:XP_009495181.1 asparaginyl-tRNA synthetase [Fonticula alba]